MSKKTNKMTPAAAVRIVKATQTKNGGKIPKGSFAVRATKAASRNTKKGN